MLERKCFIKASQVATGEWCHCCCRWVDSGVYVENEIMRQLLFVTPKSINGELFDVGRTRLLPTIRSSHSLSTVRCQSVKIREFRLVDWLTPLQIANAPRTRMQLLMSCGIVRLWNMGRMIAAPLKGVGVITW